MYTQKNEDRTYIIFLPILKAQFTEKSVTVAVFNILAHDISMHTVFKIIYLT